MQQLSNARALVVLTGFVLAGCATDLTPPDAPPAVNAPSLDASRVADVTASVQWHGIARTLTNVHPVGQQRAARLFAYLSLAEYDAVIAAKEEGERGERPSARAAVAGASAVVLTALFPSEQTAIDGEVAAEAASESGRNADHSNWSAGETIGRQVGARVVASEATDNFDLTWTGPQPAWATWVSLTGAPPVFPRLGEMRPFFLTTGSQFRPAPPPQPGSSEFESALAVVRDIARTRTPEQIAIAQFWALPGGYAAAQAYNDEIATDFITRYHLDERRAAHALAMVNMAAMDAFIACHDAKYTYWLLRPAMADPSISMAIALPNHPSYPSNHACVTGASMAILASLFPSQATYVTGLADQAAISRIYAGIHYPFDATTGLELGRTVAAYALAHDIDGREK